MQLPTERSATIAQILPKLVSSEDSIITEANKIVDQTLVLTLPIVPLVNATMYSQLI